MKHLTRALDGQNQIWKYVLVILIALIGGQLLGSIPLVIAIGIAVGLEGGAFNLPENILDFSAYGINPSLGLILIVIPFIVSLVIGMAMIRSFHQRNLKDVVNGGRNFRWDRFWSGVIIWGAVMVLVSLIDIFLIDPANYEFQFNLFAFVPLVLVSMILIPIQSGTEEYFFRGYLAQGIGALTKSPILVVLIPSILFAWLHGANPEVKEHGVLLMLPQYFLVGLSLAIIAVLDDGIELVIGIHAVNNCLGAILVSSKESVLQTPALFLEKEIDPMESLVAVVISSIIMIIIFKLMYNWDFSLLFRKLKRTESDMEDLLKNKSVASE